MTAQTKENEVAWPISSPVAKPTSNEAAPVGDRIRLILVDDDAGAVDEQVLIDDSEFAGAVELHMAAIDAHADHDVVGVVQNFRSAGCLDRAAIARSVGLGAVELSERSRGRYNKIAGPVKRGRVVAKTNGDPVGTGLGVGIVAVQMVLPIAAEVGVAGERERVGRTVAPIRG